MKQKQKFNNYWLSIVGFLMSELQGVFLENSEENVKYCFIKQYQCMVPQQIARYKRKLNKYW